MQNMSLEDKLKSNSYPGRGIVVGKSADSKYAVVAYFIMGRSVNSRNRVFVTDGDGIRTQAFDPSKLTDPSLIIYSPVRVLGDYTIATNGDQTDTIYDGMKDGKTFEQSLRIRKFEPDEPNYTPRISTVINTADKDSFGFTISILKSNEGDPSSTQRFTYDYETPKSGEGFFIHTYMGDGNPLPTFSGEPEKIEISGSIDEFTDVIWNSLNEDNKVSLFVRYIDLDTKKTETRILNKNK
ncbi:MAG: IMP cyclohydrolase [Oscillospiraceae bacterium]|nr:IMP cyclohydrolase [Oscillospiraceae bacterium]MDY3256982.1 IMP cyclohydrolase [Ruminococcus callidus]